MDDLSDPRETPLDTLAAEYGAITDDEENIDGDNDSEDDDCITPRETEILRLADEIKRKQARAKRKKKFSQIQKTPSPKKESQHLPVDSEKQLKPKFLSYGDEDHTLKLPRQTEVKGSTPYFLNILEKSRVKKTEEVKKLKELATSRVYTFSEGLNVSIKEVDELEKISGQFISKRYIDHDDLVEAFKEIKVMRINKLMAKICPPGFPEPQYPNWCVVGILSSKSDPKITATNTGRFSVLSITDFKYTIEIFLFDKAVEKYNKLRVGDIIAILNPDIYVKKYENQESFSLTIKHSMDCILEIGKAKHLGHCKSIRKDGIRCQSFINTSQETYCNFHRERQFSKSAASRMEFQTSYRINAPVKNGVKQTMLLGKRDPDFKDNVPKVRIVDDPTAPKTDPFTRARSHFKDDKSHRAFFDNEDFDNMNEEKVKERKKKDREARLKDYELRIKLQGKFREGSKLAHVFGTDEELELDIEKKRSLLGAAFSKETLASIGFDPTARSSERGLLSRTNNSETGVIGELRAITKTKKIDLGLDKEELLRRKRERQQAEETMKRLKVVPSAKATVYRNNNVKKELMKDVGKKVPTDLKREIKYPTPSANELNFSDSSDDGLEITDTSYKKFKQESNE